uniref:Uncharacterized protein n=1 Tax=viral metagenome TaxID=1070528 RepID=A0A6H1Z6V3_9ZZZZ
MNTEETKFTLKIGVVVSIVSALVIFVLTNLWIHQTDITVLKTNQGIILQAVHELKGVPVKLMEISTDLKNLDKSLDDHRAAYQTVLKKREAEELKDVLRN